MNYTLGLTTPATTGSRVLAAQQALDGGNVYAKDFLQGDVDGVFGQETGRACKRAKFWLGYPTADLKATYGPTLDSFLHGLEQPTPEMVKRQELREKQSKTKPPRDAALREAMKHLGYTESPPGSNRTQFGKWYGLDGNPWCAMFVTWCYAKTGVKAFEKGHRYSYVPYIVHDARAGVNGLIATRDPWPGDVVCYDWERNGVADHVGLFEKWLKKGASFSAVEGNTSVGDDSNGGEVMRRVRVVNQVACFVRVAA